MKTYSLSPLNFARNACKAGLSKPRCGILAVAALQRLIACPVPCRKRETEEQRSNAPSEEASMGALIAAGLARFKKQDKRYVATDSGVQWIKELTAAKLI
jgi:hypothetical protein